MSIKAFGAIRITDTTDLGEFSCYPTSNQPSAVVYDPNTYEYTPDWSTSNLILTPVAYINGENLSIDDDRLSVEWKRRIASSEEEALSTNETNNNNILTVDSNKFTPTSSSITYICYATYTDPGTNTELKSVGQITFSLIKHATELKNCDIVGENVFLHNGSRVPMGAGVITLNATLSNVSIVSWQYKDSNGEFKNYPINGLNQNTFSSTLTISVSDPVFVDDIATIKLETDDPDVYDIFTITKLYDGAAGDNNISVILTNDNHSIPTDSNGSVISYLGAETAIIIYDGDEDVTTTWDIDVTSSNGIRGHWLDDATEYWDGDYTKVFRIDELATEIGYIDFLCEKEGCSPIYKRFTVNKLHNGKDGEPLPIYDVVSSANVIHKDISGVFTPKQLFYYAYKTEINSSGGLNVGYADARFVLSASTDGVSWQEIKRTTSDAHFVDYTLESGGSIKMIKCEMYASGGTSSLLDTQTTTIVSDGVQGPAGTPGAGGTSVVVGNDSTIINCTATGEIKNSQDIVIPFSGYTGLMRAACECASPSDLPDWIVAKSNTSATTSTEGVIVLSTVKGKTINADNGDISLTFTCNESNVTKKFNWSRVCDQLESGNLQIFTPSGGNIIVNNTGSVTLEAQLTIGSVVVNEGVSYQWAKFDSNGYVDLADKTSNTLEVKANMIDSCGFFKCVATIGSGASARQFEAYYSVIDRSDPIVLNVVSTLGTQLINKQGVGAVYAVATQGGVEIDPLKTTIISATEPPKSEHVAGDYYYSLANSTCTLMKYNGTNWVEAVDEDGYSGTYNWYCRDKDGNYRDEKNAITTKVKTFRTGKIFYLDAGLIDTKVQFLLEFEINED